MRNSKLLRAALLGTACWTALALLRAGAAIRASGGPRDASSGSKAARVLVVAELAEMHVWQFQAMLWASWELLASRDRACELQPEDDDDPGMYRARVQAVDLFVACERNACQEMPASCQRWDGVAVAADGPAACFFAPYDPGPLAATYRFMPSIDFLLREPVAGFLERGRHEFVMRTDVDAVLFPGLLSFLPSGNGAVATGFSGTRLTHAMLRQFVAGAGPDGPRSTAPWRVQGVQSTFFLRRAVLGSFARRIVSTTEALLASAFTDSACAALEGSALAQELAPGKKKLCRWPYWHRGVASLYATQIAANATADVHLSDKMDRFRDSRAKRPARARLQAHLILAKQALQSLRASPRFCSDLPAAVAALSRGSASEGAISALHALAKRPELPPEAHCDVDTATFAMFVPLDAMRRMDCGSVSTPSGTKEPLRT